jgi:radical SAM protein with 4Fe4S-binding SPASM domain
MTEDAANRTRKNKTFCVAPWVHQYVGPPGDVKPCCVYEHSESLGSLKNSTLKDIWNNNTTRQLRLDLLNGIKREECSWCNDRERPFKDNFNNIYFHQRPDIQKIVNETNEDGSVDEHKLFYMDIRFNNLCNFRCRTCGSHFSTSIAAEEKLLSPNSKNVGFQYPGQTEDQVFSEMLPHLPHLVEVYFAGGEPMMQKEHYQTLERLVEIGNTSATIKYNTNFSKLKLGKWDVINYWKNFTEVVVMASLDASYERAEYWRKGTVWKEIVENRRRMIKECPNVSFFISPAISWVNALNVLDFHREWTEQGLVKINNIMVNELVTPEWFCMKNIPDWKKSQIEAAFRNHIDWLKKNQAQNQTIFKFESAINFMYSDIKKTSEFPAEEFYSLITKFDNSRGENFFKVFTEHHDMRDYLKDRGFDF